MNTLKIKIPYIISSENGKLYVFNDIWRILLVFAVCRRHLLVLLKSRASVLDGASCKSSFLAGVFLTTNCAIYPMLFVQCYCCYKDYVFSLTLTTLKLFHLLPNIVEKMEAGFPHSLIPVSFEGHLESGKAQTNEFGRAGSQKRLALRHTSCRTFSSMIYKL